MIKRYCTKAGCSGGSSCTSTKLSPDRQCPMEYVAYPEDSPHSLYNWTGDGDPPPFWYVGTAKVYCCYNDYLNDGKKK